MNVASRANAVRLSPLLPREPRIGDFFQWPWEADTFACIIAFAKFGKVHATPFYRRSSCNEHADAGDCWRCLMPLQSQLIKLPETAYGNLLTPRIAGARVAGTRQLHQRCYQRVGVAPPHVHPSNIETGILEFIARAAEDLVGGVDANCDVDGIGDGPAGEIDNLKIWTDTTGDIYADVVNRSIHYSIPPTRCPSADENPCRIILRGQRRSKLFISDDGCSRLMGQMYSCASHSCRWSAPHGEASTDCNIVGDVISRDFLIAGDFWPEALAVFQETESYRAVEKLLRRRTVSRIMKAVEGHRLRDTMSKLEAMLLHRAVTAFCDGTPDAQTVKKWLVAWVGTYLGPLIPGLAVEVCTTHGVIGNIDFSASDARQLRQIAKHGKRCVREKRTFGGISGLADVPLLPDLYAHAEDRPNIETLVLTWLRLLVKVGIQPVGFNVDDIAKSFKIIVGCLDAALPGAVLFAKASSAPAKKHLEKCGIVVDLDDHKVLGFELGQDALHVYGRLLKAINSKSLDAAWSIRCLRKWLGSLNPEVRFGRCNAEPLFGGDDPVHAAPGSAPADVVAEDVPAVLDVYFKGQALPNNAFRVLRAGLDIEWLHPQHGGKMPLPAKAAILEDAALASDVASSDRAKIASLVFQLVYAPAGHPCPKSITADLNGMAALFQASNFEKARAGAPPQWFRAQVRYLKHARIRASGPTRGATKPREDLSILTRYKASWKPRLSNLQCGEGHNLVEYQESDDGECDECGAMIRQHGVVFDCRTCAKYWCAGCGVMQGAVASSDQGGETEASADVSSDGDSAAPADEPEADGDEVGDVEQANPGTVGVCAARTCFLNVVANQSHPLVINGLYASYRCKLWAMLNGRTISLGTVGKERDWRNKQRRNRNKARSRADIATVHMLTLIRYVEEVAARTAAGRRREQGVKCGRPDRVQDSALAATGIASAILHGQNVKAPLALASASRTVAASKPEDVGYIYKLFHAGQL